MDANLMEAARPRFQAAPVAYFLVDTGEGDRLVARESATLVKPGPVLVAATVATSWLTVLGLVVDLGTDGTDTTKTRRLLVDLSAIVGMGIKD